jgi:hypothetical protein
MLPRDLKAEQFAAYPPRARALAVAHIEALRPLPLSFVPSLLREVIDYDYKFPAERGAIDREVANLSALSPAQVNGWFESFSQFKLSAKLEQFDWVNQPAQFVEQLSAYLWTTHQQDDFRKAATTYGDRLQKAMPAPQIPVRRLGIAIIGQGVDTYDAPLFRNLRPHGAYFSRVDPGRGNEFLLAAVARRAEAHPVPYGHWYIDGGAPVEHSPLLTPVSYQSLEPVRMELLNKMQVQIQRPGMGPEELRTYLARLTPADLNMPAGDEVLNRFAIKMLTEGSGTQIFSTTFAQWTAREALRRAQALTLLVRFAPRQRQKPMNELLSGSEIDAAVDLPGSVVDGDMGAYYTWLNQQRLPGAEQSGFIVWFEGHNQAVVIGPKIPPGSVSNDVANLSELVGLATS